MKKRGSSAFSPILKAAYSRFLDNHLEYLPGLVRPLEGISKFLVYLEDAQRLTNDAKCRTNCIIKDGQGAEKWLKGSGLWKGVEP